jgi:hypothetical protein
MMIAQEAGRSRSEKPMHGSTFEYRANAEGKVFIYWKGKQVRTLKGPAAAGFLSRAEVASSEECQLIMARITGNFKRGNERQGEPRDRGGG